MKPTKPHPSMRGFFSYYLYEAMANDDRIFVLTGDLGYGMFDAIRDDFSDRFVNCGASEQAMMGIAIGLSKMGKIPVVYSITPFLIYRAFETIRNYIDVESLNVKLIGSGRDDDYKHDGHSHDASDITTFMNGFTNIAQVFPDTMYEIEETISVMLDYEGSMFLSLKR